jgi:hypothetical protein
MFERRLVGWFTKKGRYRVKFQFSFFFIILLCLVILSVFKNNFVFACDSADLMIFLNFTVIGH